MRVARVEPLTTARTLRGPFDYRLPDDFGEVAVGAVLEVPFGRRKVVGVVVELASGSDLAVSSADITITGNDLLSIAEAMRISKRTYTIIRQNLFWAFVYNTIGIPLAALGFLSPMLAGAAMALGVLGLVVFAARLVRSAIRRLLADDNDVTGVLQVVAAGVCVCVSVVLTLFGSVRLLSPGSWIAALSPESAIALRIMEAL